MNSSTLKPYLPLVLILVVMGIYLSAISPVVYLGDSGELTAAAFSLGVPHGSGYPVYTLIGKLFCMIPLGNIGFRMNLMSAFFTLAATFLGYSLVLTMTRSCLASLITALSMAFVPLIWSQGMSAEVYSLHLFFLTLILRLLWLWEERREFFILVLLAFISGLSFGNHLQTVMLGPAIIFMILSGDRRALLKLDRLLILSVFFLIALLVYLYLPLRTGAGAAIHWGDPDNLERFWAHVSGRSHRAGYVFNMGPWQYMIRFKESVLMAGKQLGMLLIFSLWGLIIWHGFRWKFFIIAIIFFDFIYTVFLNTINLEVTPFSLSSTIVLFIAMGKGLADIMTRMQNSRYLTRNVKRMLKGALLLIPAVLLVSNYSFCDQSRNYTAHEYAVNIFRTAGNGGVLFVESDNQVFPVAYGRIVERRREEDLTIFDRYNLIFQIPGLHRDIGPGGLTWEENRDRIEQQIIRNRGMKDVFFAADNTSTIKMPDHYFLIPYGILYRVATKEDQSNGLKIEKPWRFYSTESFYDEFDRDFMNRVVTSFFYFKKGMFYFMTKRHDMGFNYLKLASAVGYDNWILHSDMGIFLSDLGYFQDAREAFERATEYKLNKGGINNNWGYFYFKKKEYDKATPYFKRAIELNPRNYRYYNNLALNYFEAGETIKAGNLLKESLRLNNNQPKIKKFIKNNNLKTD